MIAMKSCRKCATEFEPKQLNQQYCEQHRQSPKAAKPKVCKSCGKEFGYTHPAQGLCELCRTKECERPGCTNRIPSSAARVCCSKACRVMMPNTRECRECGRDFEYKWRVEAFRYYCDEHVTVECRHPDCVNRIPRNNGADYCSEECRAISYVDRGEKQQIIDTCDCGKAFRRYRNLCRQRYCSEECRKKYTRSGDRFRNNPELARLAGSLPKPNHGLRGHKQSEEHLIKRLGTTAIRASKEELSLAPALSKLGFRHTGEGAFWRRWKDGTLHNPDFVNEERHVVVEYFGSYWHDKDRGREAEIQQAWGEIGWDCLIIWSDEREGFLADPMVWGFG